MELEPPPPTSAAPEGPPEDPLLGAMVGPYRVEGRVGEGATCVVYRARRAEDGDRVALKLLRGALRRESRLAQRLRREAAASMRIAHPNVVRVFEYGSSPAVGPYLAMELLEGRTLHALLAAEGALAPLRAARLLRGVAAGLAAAHRAGYVHRDLKPENLMLLAEGEVERVKLLDFGIVGLAAPATRALRLTDDGLVLGTPCYMAPEQLDRAAVTPAADLYALGAIAYHLLAGRPPFEGSFREVVAQHLVSPPAELPAAGALGALTLQLLAKTPAGRPASADAVEATLERLSLEGEGSLGVADGARAPAGRPTADASPPGPEGPAPDASPRPTDVPPRKATSALHSTAARLRGFVRAFGRAPLWASIPVMLALGATLGALAAAALWRVSWRSAAAGG